MTSNVDLEISKPEPETNPETEQEILSEKVTRKNIIISIVIIVVILALIVLATIFLLQSDKTSQIRDIFLIFMALESLIIGVALVILIVQLSTLINLLQNEIRPIINSTSETVNTLKGTAQFLSDNLAEPVIKINSFAAKISRLFKSSKK